LGQKVFLAESDQVVADQFGDDVFLVNFRNGRYYAMRGSAVLVWRLLQTPRTAETIANILQRVLNSVPDHVDVEISTFLKLLESEGLASESGQAAIEVHDLEIHDGAGYHMPLLEMFDDLSELITIDPVHEVDNERGWPVQPKT
jgi:hypothetical protein